MTPHGISSASKRRKRGSFIESVGQIAIPGAASVQDVPRALGSPHNGNIVDQIKPTMDGSRAAVSSSFLAKLIAVAELPEPVTTPRGPPAQEQPILKSKPVPDFGTASSPQQTEAQPAAPPTQRQSRVRAPRSHFKPVEEPVVVPTASSIQITELDEADGQNGSRFAKQLKKAALTYVEQAKAEPDYDAMFDMPEPFVILMSPSPNHQNKILMLFVGIKGHHWQLAVGSRSCLRHEYPWLPHLHQSQ
jgi:hypothetical protein